MNREEAENTLRTWLQCPVAFEGRCNKEENGCNPGFCWTREGIRNAVKILLGENEEEE